eukprot:EG_transcript_1213
MGGPPVGPPQPPSRTPPAHTAVRGAASLVIVALAAVLQALVRNDAEANLCHMTYLMPHFQPIAVDVGRDRQLLRYGLFRYIELSVEESPVARHQPVLYVPGNAGHFRQVRSLGGHTLRATAQSPARLTFFTVDFREELSAAHAQVALDQALFLNYCLRTVLAQPGSRASVVVVGHSVGGVLARVAPLLWNYPPQSIAALITLSSPHRGLPIAVDASAPHLYRRLHAAGRPCAAPLANVSVLSISGGLRDNQVKPPPSSLDRLGTCPQLSVTTYAVEGVAISADHLCVMWCNQVMARLSTTLTAFALVDGPKSPRRRSALLRALWAERTALRLGFWPVFRPRAAHELYVFDPSGAVLSLSGQLKPHRAEGPITLLHPEGRGVSAVTYSFGLRQFHLDGLDTFLLAANVPPTALRLFGHNRTAGKPVSLSMRPAGSERPSATSILWRIIPQTAPDLCVQLPHGTVDERHDPAPTAPYLFPAAVCYVPLAALPGVATLLAEVPAQVPPLVHPFSRPADPRGEADAQSLGPTIGHATFFRFRDAQREYHSPPVTAASSPGCPLLNVTLREVDTRYAYALEVQQTCPAAQHPLHPAVYVFTEALGARESRWHYGMPASMAEGAGAVHKEATYRHLHRFSFIAAQPVPVHVLLVVHPHCTALLNIRVDWWHTVGHSLYSAVPLLLSLPIAMLCFAIAHFLRRLRLELRDPDHVTFMDSLVYVARYRLPLLAGFLSTAQANTAVLHGLFFLDCRVATATHAVGNALRQGWRRWAGEAGPGARYFAAEEWDYTVLPACSPEDFDALYGGLRRLSAPDLGLLLGCSVALVLPVYGLVGGCQAAMSWLPRRASAEHYCAPVTPQFLSPPMRACIASVLLAAFSLLGVLHSTACLVAAFFLLLALGPAGWPPDSLGAQRRVFLIQYRLLATVVLTAILLGLPSFVAYVQHMMQAEVPGAALRSFADSHSLLAAPLCCLGLRAAWRRSTAGPCPPVDGRGAGPPVEWPLPSSAWWLFEAGGLLCCTGAALAPHRVFYFLSAAAAALCLWPSPRPATATPSPKRTD